MATIIDKSMHTPQIYKNLIHPKIVDKLHLQDSEDLIAEQRDAQFLEECFNDIKRISIGDMNLDSSPFSAVLNQEMINRLNSYGIFKYIGAPRWGASNQGVAFEYDLARIITEILFSATGQEIIEDNISQFIEPMLTGKKSASVDKRFNPQQAATLLGITVKKLAKMTNQELSNTLQRQIDSKTGEPFYTLVGRSGVVDINVSNSINNATIKYNFEPNSILERLFNILSTASFSAKNYLVSTVMKGINLGFASDIRFMSSVLSYAGFDEQDIGSIYGRTRNYLESRKYGYGTVASHLRHLRFAYELMGIGQSTGEAKFLVINQRIMQGEEMAILTKLLGRSYFKDTKRGEIRVFSNRWLIGQVYNDLLYQQVSVQGNVIFINDIKGV